MRRFDKGPCYMEENDDGRYVLHSDYAAELAEWKQRAERAEAYVAGENLRSDFRTAAEMRAALDSTISSIVNACKGSGCLNAHELRAALDRTHKRATNAEKENALLRAECEAWRAAETEAKERSWSKAMYIHADRINAAQDATDEAGALKVYVCVDRADDARGMAQASGRGGNQHRRARIAGEGADGGARRAGGGGAGAGGGSQRRMELERRGHV